MAHTPVAFDYCLNTHLRIQICGSSIVLSVQSILPLTIHPYILFLRCSISTSVQIPLSRSFTTYIACLSPSLFGIKQTPFDSTSLLPPLLCAQTGRKRCFDCSDLTPHRW